MGNEFTAEEVDNAQNVGEIISVVKEEINALKVLCLYMTFQVYPWLVTIFSCTAE